MLTQERKDYVREAVEGAIRHWGKFHLCNFGVSFTQEEKEYAIHIGQKFGVQYGRDSQDIVDRKYLRVMGPERK